MACQRFGLIHTPALLLNGGAGVLFYKAGETMNNEMRATFASELRNSIQSSIQYGKELERLDSRFGKLVTRIGTVNNSIRSFHREVNRDKGTKLHQQTSEERNSMPNKGIVQRAGTLSQRMPELQSQMQRVSDEVQGKVKRSIHLELHELVESIEALDIKSSPKLKKHLISQMNLINKKLIQKIREQFDLQVEQLMQEFGQSSGRLQNLNRAYPPFLSSSGTLRTDNGIAGGSTTASGKATGSTAPEETALAANVVTAINAQNAAITSIRNNLAVSGATDPSSLLYQAIDIFNNIQQEEIKLYRSLSLKKDFRVDPNNSQSQVDQGKLSSAIEGIKGFVREQTSFYGLPYKQLFEVASIGGKTLDDPAEIKKLVQQVAQIKTIDPSSDMKTIANGLLETKDKLGLSMQEIDEKIVRSIAAVTQIGAANSEQILQMINKSGNTFKSKTDADMLVGLSAASIQTNTSLGTYDKILKRFESDNGRDKAKELGIKTEEIDPATGGTKERSAESMYKDFANMLSSLHNRTERDKLIDSFFGTKEGGKGAASQEALLTQKHAEFIGEMQGFDQSRYEEMLQQSLQNPSVNMNRVNSSLEVALDALVTELTPSINKVSYMLMNMADGVSKNIHLFVSLADVLSNALLGLMLMKGIKWSWQKSGIPQNWEKQKELSSYVNRFKGMESDPALTSLIGNGLKGNNRKLYQQATDLQGNQTFLKRMQEFNSMSKAQHEHFKKYVGHSGQKVNDLPTFFTMMEESKSWKEKGKVSYQERFNRNQTYANRLKTNPESNKLIHTPLLNTLLTNTRDRSTFVHKMGSNSGYKSAATRLGTMSQTEFDGFEKHLQELRRNGSPAINSITRLNQALDSYQNTLRQSATVTRNSSATYLELSHAMRSINEQAGSNKMGDKFKNFLQDASGLAKGAGGGVGGLASKLVKGLAGAVVGLIAETVKMGVQLVAQLALAQAAKTVAINLTTTEDQRQLMGAEKQEKDIVEVANHLRVLGDSGFLSFPDYLNKINLGYGDLMNFVSRNSGGKDTHLGSGQAEEMMDGVREMYNKRGANLKNKVQLANYLRDNDISKEEAVNAWAEESGRKKEIQELKKQSFSKQYQRTQLENKEKALLEQEAKKSYDEKYKNGLLPNITADEGKARLKEGFTEVQKKNEKENLQAELDGLATDSQAFIAMKEGQIKRLEEVLNRELEIVDKYIEEYAKQLQSIQDKNSDQYKDKEKQYKESIDTRKSVQEDGQQQINKDKHAEQQRQFQSKFSSVQQGLQLAEQVAQAKELMVGINMDRQSKAYIGALQKITDSKISDLRMRLADMKAIEAKGDQRKEIESAIRDVENSIYNEQLRYKDLSLSKIGIERIDLEEKASDRENNYLAEKVRRGGASDDSPGMRALRISSAKQEVQDINKLIGQYKKDMVDKSPEEQKKYTQEIRDLTKQSLQAQLGILEEVKSPVGTFNLPDGVTAMSRYEYLTRGNTHQSFTVGSGDVTVNIALPNVTSSTTDAQLSAIGNGIGRGLFTGRVGGMRDQMLMGTAAYRSNYP
ncbi:hypothetical protein EEL30_17675 [Brevibacillus laterosporus]|uniref:Phage tail tape measure protein n=1 Tax=Brevibacillus laterosporus TaxID=1465 RepID=A0A518VAG4_BRELA|nr:hypothetical protein EEL30_17675 [Brevibacillus laterosporus]